MQVRRGRHRFTALPLSPGEAVAQLHARRSRASSAAGLARTSRAVQTFTARFGVPECNDRPVFLLATGWRSGSTLLQRLIVSSGQVFVWGEPYARCDHVRRLAGALWPFVESWPREEDLHAGADVDAGLSRQWIANLSPSPGALVTAHRIFLQTLLAPPGKGLDWGMKEVRLDAGHARYLRLLFPEARLVFQVRNPYDQWRSYARWRNWYDPWPRRVSTPEQFGVMWAHLAASLLDAAEELEAHVVRYEDLVADTRTVDALGEHLGVVLDAQTLADRVAGEGGVRVVVPARELERLRRTVEPVATRLGYEL